MSSGRTAHEQPAFRPHRPRAVAGHPQALANASGIGMHTTTVNLAARWDADYGAILDSARSPKLSAAQAADLLTQTAHIRSALAC